MKKAPGKPVVKEAIVELKKTDSKNIGNILGFVLSIVAFLLYANTLSHQYTVDDATVLANNKLTTQGAKAIPEIFTSAYRKGFWERKESLYRPLSVAMFAIEWQIAPNNPHLGHWLNVLFYAITAFVLFSFLNNLFRDYKMYLAFFISLLFITHPIHTEVIANIKSRDEILSFLFAILSLKMLLKYFETKSILYFIVTSFYFLLSLLSKESAVTLVLVAPLIFYFFRNVQVKKSILLSIPILITVVIYLTIRFLVLGGITNFTEILPINNSIVTADSFVSQKATAIFILGKYASLLFFPHTLCFDYSFNQIPNQNLANAGVLISLLFFTFLLFYALKKIRVKQLLSFGILFFLITISITSNVFFLIESVMAERFVYLPSLGFCIAVVASLALLLKFQPKAKDVTNLASLYNVNKPLSLVLTIICTLFSFKTIARNFDWKDNLTLLSTDVKTSPESARIRYAFGSAILIEQALKEDDEGGKQNLLSKSIEQLEKGVSILNTYSDAFYHLGLAYKEKKDFPNAVKNFEAAMRNKTWNDADFFIAAGVAYGMNKQYEQSVATLNKALALKPGNAETYNNLGVYYDEWGKTDSSIWALNKAIELDGKSQSAFYNMGNTYAHKGDFNKAIEFYKKSLELNPDNVDAINNIGNSYASQKDFSNALNYFLKALEMDSSNAKAINNVGITYMMLGNKERGDYYMSKLNRR